MRRLAIVAAVPLGIVSVAVFVAIWRNPEADALGLWAAVLTMVAAVQLFVWGLGTRLSGRGMTSDHPTDEASFARLHAHPAEHSEARGAVSALHEAAYALGIEPVPALYVAPVDTLNALVAPMDDRSLRVVVTRGMARSLPPDQLRAVFASLLARGFFDLDPTTPLPRDEADVRSVLATREPDALLAALDAVLAAPHGWPAADDGAAYYDGCFVSPADWADGLTERDIERLLRLRLEYGAVDV